MTPLPALIVKPAGNPVADHAYGDVPPAAVTVVLGYGRLIVDAGNDAGPLTERLLMIKE